MRRLGLFLATVALAFGLAVGAPGAATADNSAIAINTHDGSSVFRFAFAIRRVGGDVVDETNSAVAFASCTDCQTTAIAIEIVLMEGSPSTYTPTNQAIAINYQCNLCQTFAAAYQFVIQGSGPMHFTHDGLRQLHQIRKAIKKLEDQNLSPFDLQAQLDPLITQLKDVLATQLVTGPPGDQEPTDPGDRGPPPEAPPGSDHHEKTGTDATATETTPTGSATTTTTPAPTTTTAPATTTTPTTTSTVPATTTGTTTTTAETTTTVPTTTTAPTTTTTP